MYILVFQDSFAELFVCILEGASFENNDDDVDYDNDDVEV